MSERCGLGVPASSAVAVALLLAGCVMPDQLAQLQKDVADVRQETAALRKAQADASSTLAELDAKVQAGGEVKRTDFADLKLEVDRVQRDMAALDERGNDMQRRMDRLSQDVARERDAVRRSDLAGTSPPSPVPGAPADPPAGAGVITATPPTSGATPSPDALYNQAYADFSKGNYALAVSGFEEYASRFPDSSQADNAVYWIGECHFSEGRFDQAVEAFDRMLDRYADSEKVAAANLKKGLAYLEENDVKLAIVQLRYVTTTYPASDEAKIAREKLASLGASR